MKFTPEYFVAGLFILIGLLALTFKPFYEEDNRTNFRKASIYQGWAMFVFGLYLLFLKIGLNYIGLSGWWPVGLFVGVIALLIITFRLRNQDANSFSFIIYHYIG